MPRDLNDDRLERLRGDLAALRARTAAELTAGLTSTGLVRPHDEQSPATPEGESPAATPPVGTPSPNGVPGRDHGRPTAELPAAPPRPAARPVAPGQESRTPRAGRTRPVVARRSRPPRPPARPLLRRGGRQPSRRRAVPTPITVRRRPSYIAGPRWPVWGWTSGIVALLVLLPAVAQLAYRLLQAMADTTAILGGDPSRTDYLQAAAGVAGGGLTLALAIAALAVVKGRMGYLAGAVGILAFFALLPYVAYTATAGIVSAPLPPLQQMIQPLGWQYHAQLLAVFWLCAGALIASILDLLYRSVVALQRTLTR